MKECPRVVLCFAVFIAIWVLIAGFFNERNGGVDELGLYNPSYMVARYGSLTYPIYGYVKEPVIIHPPVHVGVIGLFLRLGLTWYYAEAAPTVLLLLLCVVFVVRGSFSAPVKLGLLFAVGLGASIGDNFGEVFGTRPEGHIQAAWFTALVLLEDARLKNWNRNRLFGGAALLVWAATLHYYAWPALLGIATYALLAIRSNGWRSSRPALVALCAGACLIGLPYLTIYLIPYRKQIIDAIRGSQGTGGISQSISIHLDMYREWARDFHHVPWLIRIALIPRIPLMVFSTAILAALRCTRGIAWAALPWQVCIFLFASHKQGSYLIHELMLFEAALVAILVMGGAWLVARIPRLKVAALLPATAAMALGLSLPLNTGLLAGVVIRDEPRVHEGEVARAACREILGHGASVASRLGAWYTSGALYWHDTFTDLFQQPKSYDPASYFGTFDAVADYNHRSGDAMNGDHTVSSWYAEGLLKLRGFFLGESGGDVQILLLSVKRVPQVIGYGAHRGELYRFEEYADGDYLVTSSACGALESNGAYWDLRVSGVMNSVLLLPGGGLLVTVLTPRRSPLPVPWLGSCRVVSNVRGSLTIADKRTLIARLRRDDAPIHVVQRLDDVPGFAGLPVPPELTPPSDSVRLDHVLDLAHIQTTTDQAKIDRMPHVRLSTAHGAGAFSAQIPIAQNPTLHVPYWIQLRLRVHAGKIGLLVLDRKFQTIAMAKASLSKTEQPVDVAFRIDDLSQACCVIFFNDDWITSQVDVLDATVVVKQLDWSRNTEALAKVR